MTDKINNIDMRSPALIGLYSDDRRIPSPNGDRAEAMIAAMRERFTARYRLIPVVGRKEELTEPNTDRRVSIGYATKTIRVRLQDGRRWLQTRDFPIREGWHSEVYNFVDPHFRFVAPTSLATPSR